MPSQYCFLCASDEGVFLDITTENEQTFCTQFKICSLVKAPTSDQLPTKICHKCAYEVNHCSTFLQKYKKAAKHRNQNRKKCCSLCFEQTNKEYIFDLKKQDTLQLKSINKIQQILKDEIDKVEGNSILVCLPCRYTVDVLFDLKNLSNEISSKLDNKIEEDIDYSRFPKVKTTVISRKTTITESARVTLKPRQNTESDSDAMIRTRSKAKVNNNRVNNKVGGKSGEQVCEECHSLVTADSDAHKNEKTGKTLCKVCWENGRSNAKDVEAQSPAETKVCKVFLKDVLSQTAAQKGKQANEIEKDNQNKRKRKVTMAKQSKSVSGDTESNTGKQVEKRSIRSENTDDSDNRDIPNKKAKRSAKEAVSDQEPQTEPVLPRSTRNRKAIADNRHAAQSSDSDSALSSSNVKEPKVPLTVRKRAIRSPPSDVDVEIKRDRTRLKSILTSNSSIKGSDINDGSSTDDGVSKKKKLRFQSDSPIYIDLTTQPERSERTRRSATKRSAVDAEKVAKPSLVKKPLESETNADSALEEEIRTYSCEECGVSYENKLVFLMHKLTHCKQPKLELKKVTVESKPKEVSLGTSEAADEQFDDQSETIRITVDDDEEEAEVEVEEDDVSPQKDTPTDTIDTQEPSKELDSEQLTENDDKVGKSLQGRRSRSLSGGSTDKTNAENVPELVEEENVEDISLTNIEDDQEEEDEEEEKEDGRESEKKVQDEKDADLEDAITDAVEEDKKEAETRDEKKPKETTSEETLGEDVDVEKLVCSQIIQADRTQEESKLNSSDGAEEKNDTASSEEPEENKVEEKERRNSSDVPEEKSELHDKSEPNLVEKDNLGSSDNSEEVRVYENDKTDSPSRSEERRSPRKSRSVHLAKLEEKDKQDSPEHSREKSSSPGKSEERRSPRRSKSSPIARLEKDTRESSETQEERDKLGSPVRSEERKSTNKTRSSVLGKIEEDKQDTPENPEEKDKLGSLAKFEERMSTRRSKSGVIGTIPDDKGETPEKPEEEDKLCSPVRSEERMSTRRSKSGVVEKIPEDKEESPEKPEVEDKLGSFARSEEGNSTRRSKSGVVGKIAEDKEESPEKLEEEDKLGSPGEAEEKKVTRNSKSGIFGKSEEKDKQDSSEKSKDNPDSLEKVDKSESEAKGADKDESIIEIIDDDSLDSVKEVCEKECDNEIGTEYDATEVQTVEFDVEDDNLPDVEEVCEQKDDDEADDEEVQCVEINCSDKSSKRKSDDIQTSIDDIVEVQPTSESADVAAEILKEVLDLASAQIQKRQDGDKIDGGNDYDDAETLENISREVQNGSDTIP